MKNICTWLEMNQGEVLDGLIGCVAFGVSFVLLIVLTFLALAW